MVQKSPIGVFDSGYGGLTVLRNIVSHLPQYDYIYLGDNARAPYGSRSFHTVYQYTLQCVKWFFAQGCSLVVLACNTASAKALRSIQQNDLDAIAPGKKVLGVIRPTTEVIGRYTKTGDVGILGTVGTVRSQSYPIEIKKFYPAVRVYQQACPLLVPLIENNDYQNDGARFFIRQYTQGLMQQSEYIDTVLLACTHYPLLKDEIAAALPPHISLLSQGDIVADSLADYLNRHPEVEMRCSQARQRHFFTTEDPDSFNQQASLFYGTAVSSQKVEIGY